MSVSSIIADCREVLEVAAGGTELVADAGIGSWVMVVVVVEMGCWVMVVVVVEMGCWVMVVVVVETGCWVMVVVVVDAGSWVMVEVVDPSSCDMGVVVGVEVLMLV